MSTREPGAEPPVIQPEELRLALGLLPSNAATPTASVPTPGVALAGARVPGGPTLPEVDPMSLGAVTARMANELFGAPVVGGYPNAPASVPAGVPAGAPASTPASAAIGGVPASPVLDVNDRGATPPSAAASVPGASAAQPFSIAPSFAGLGDFTLPPASSVPLIDVWTAPPAVDAEVPRAATPPEPLIPALDYELVPATGVTLDPGPGTAFDPHAIRREFPILEERIHGRRLIWLDNAATTQKPKAVIDRLTYFYEHENSNIHRAAHTLAARATEAYEKAREAVRRFINAPSAQEIIFVRGATEGINLVAQSWGRRNIAEGDEVVITWLEHHANIVPWQMLCAEKGARLRIAPVDDRGQILLDEYEKLLGPKTRLVALPQISNALGTITPAREMIELAHRHGAKVLLDAAQSVSHMRADVQALDCDFFVFSGHKVFAPTGIGVVFGKAKLLEAMPPWQGGGNMIQDVTFERTVYQGPPARFEAGTGNIADAVGLGAALDWLSRIGVENVQRYEHELLAYLTAGLSTVPGLTIIGTAPEKAGVVSFILAGQKTEEVGGMLDQEGIAVRSGHHCAQPILRRFGVEATVRASLAPYNTYEDIDALVAALHRIQRGYGTLG